MKLYLLVRDAYIEGLGRFMRFGEDCSKILETLTLIAWLVLLADA